MVAGEALNTEVVEHGTVDGPVAVGASVKTGASLAPGLDELLPRAPLT